LLFENLIAREAAKIVQEYDYGPFGNTIDAQGYSENGYRFTGKETDFETGLIYFGARYYDPEIGRFITKDIVDPLLSNPQDLNRYVYCLNNPLKYVDPFGLSWWNPFSWDWGGIWDAFTDFFTDTIPDFFESFGNWFSGEGWHTDAELRGINRLTTDFLGRLSGGLIIRDPILSDPNVMVGMLKAWNESLDGQIRVYEQGGWIVQNPKGTLAVQRWPRGESGSIRIPSRSKGTVASFHTHPYASHEVFVHGPSGLDYYQARVGLLYGINNYIIDRIGIMQFFPSSGSYSPYTGTYRDILRW